MIICSPKIPKDHIKIKKVKNSGANRFHLHIMANVQKFANVQN